MHHTIIFDSNNNCHEVHSLYDDWFDNLIKNVSFFTGSAKSITEYIEAYINKTKLDIKSHSKIPLSPLGNFSKINLLNPDTRHFYLVDVPSQNIFSLCSYTNLEIIFAYNFLSAASDSNTDKILAYKNLIDSGLYPINDGLLQKSSQEFFLKSINDYLKNPTQSVKMNGYQRSTYILLDLEKSPWSINYDLDPLSLEMNEKIIHFLVNKGLTITPTHQRHWLDFINDELTSRPSFIATAENNYIKNLFDIINQRQSLEVSLECQGNKKVIAKL